MPFQIEKQQIHSAKYFLNEYYNPLYICFQCEGASLEAGEEVVCVPDILFHNPLSA